MSAPTRIAATFVGGSLDGKWTYLGALNSLVASYVSPKQEHYELVDTIWHSTEDSVLSHQVYRLVKRAKAGM